jgi:uncharacterized glyoxalase superfamily protein PhnB
MAAKPIPEGYRTVTPHLTVKGAAEAIDFYKKAFGAVELQRMPGPDGKRIMHAALKIGDSIILMNDEFPEMGGKPNSPTSLKGSTVTLHLFVPDVDKSFAQAVAAGCKATMPLMDMFWGDRYGKVTDPYGHEWSLATHKEDLTPQQMAERGAKAFAGKPS